MYSNNFFLDVLKLFKSNVPTFFHASEQILFQNFLSKERINYYLLFNSNNQLVASGGYELEEHPNTIMLTWGMVDASYHKNGYGRSLTEFRLNSISNTFPKSEVILNTTQKTFRFYEKFGFKLVSIKKDYYGLGLDRYDMIKSKIKNYVGPAGLEPATP